MRETLAQESALLQARHRLELDQIRRQNQEQQEKLDGLHQQDMSEFQLFSRCYFYYERL